MKKSLLQNFIELSGFALVGMLFFIWFLGNHKNSNTQQFESIPSLKAEVKEYDAAQEDELVISSDDYSPRASKYSRPEPISGKAKTIDYTPVKETRKSERTISHYTKAKKNAETVRSWKGSHRDESFAWLCFDRFGEDVVQISEQYGLHPDVLLARIIAYSYEYIEHPRQDLTDNNFTAMRKPKSKKRAIFETPLESIKAYAVVNAGEVNQLSSEGAIAKHDRAWTMRKLIEKYEFIANLRAEDTAYKGKMGKANDFSEEEVYKHEYAGETIKMISNVESKVKKRRAKDAGYESWDDFMESLPEGRRIEQEDNIKNVTAAIAKKKSFNLSRRVSAKKRD